MESLQWLDLQGPHFRVVNHPALFPFQANLEFAPIAFTATISPPHPFYLSINKAWDLAQCLSEVPTAQTLKRLERDFKKTTDPCSRKKQSPPSDEIIDLEWSENEVDVFIVDTTLVASPSGSARRYVTNRVLSNESNNSTAPKVKGSSLVVASKYICHTLSKPMSDTEAEWMLDSGASWHFTHNINNFVEYEAIDPVLLKTVTNYTWIMGKATVILTTNQKTV